MAKTRISDTSIIKEDHLTSFVRVVTALIFLIFMTVLTMTSLLQTTGIRIVKEGEGQDTVVTRIREGLEVVVYNSDSFLTNVAMLALFIAVCYTVLPLLKKLPLIAELTFITVWTLGLGFVWVQTSQSSPSEDSWMVAEAARSFAHGIYDTLTDENDRYFRNYSFQLGTVLLNELLINLHEVFHKTDRLLFLEFWNAVFLAAANAGIVLITDTVFSDKRVRHITVLLLTFSIAPIIFTSFIYGIIPGFCFAVWAIYFELMFLKSESLSRQILFGLLSAAFITMAVAVKSNNLIPLVAICIMACASMFSRKRFVKNAVYIAVSAVMALSVDPLIKTYYENRAGVDLGEAIPYICWFDLGLSESINAPGWYNYAGLHDFEDSDFDPQKATELASRHIADRIEVFRQNRQYARDFFYRKFVSQWNETTYQSIWTNNVRRQYDPKYGIAKWVCQEHEPGVSRYMDYFAQFVFLMVLIGAVLLLKERNLPAVMFPMMILGGMLYHLMAEAKSQYSIPYFILMTGFAGYGLVYVNDRLAVKLNAFIDSVKQAAADDAPAAAPSGEAPEAAAEEAPADTEEQPAVSEASAQKEKE